MQSLGIIESTSDGTAIWHCRIKANSGWCPPKAFSLLRIKPEIAWENFSDRPEVFLGCVDIENESVLDSTENSKIETVSNVTEPETSHMISLDMDVQPSFENDLSQNTEVDAKPEETTDTIDLVMGLFSPTDQSQEHQEYQERVEEQKTLSTLQINEPVTDIEVTKTASRASKESADISGESFVEWLKAGITQNINQKVKAFDLTEIKEQQDAAQVAGELFSKITGDVAKAFNFEDGSQEKNPDARDCGCVGSENGDGNNEREKVNKLELKLLKA